MHEASLAQALLRQVEDLAQQHHGRRVTEVRVTVGEFSGVEPELLASAFERATPGSVAQGARLVMARASLRAKCSRCDHEFHVERFRFACPLCGAAETKVIDGEQLMLDRVFMETDA
ncbi:MAG: hydrogenase maturation nickel metallochaperone HypA [Planctomycetales bacterium]|nr:hydrogenase maturation nickel metallochaperone HypA [Planctomycetales bacterium]